MKVADMVEIHVLIVIVIVVSKEAISISFNQQKFLYMTTYRQ